MSANFEPPVDDSDPGPSASSAPNEEVVAPPRRLTFDERVALAEAEREKERELEVARSRVKLSTNIDLVGTLAAIRSGCREWLIEGVWIHGEYGVLAAEPKLGKTTMIIDLVLAVCTGRKWLGQYQAKKGRVLMFAGEGGEMSLVARIDAVARFHGVSMEELAPVLRVVGAVPRIRSEEDMTVLAEIVAAEADGFSPDLVVIDPAYMAAGGVDAKQVTDMGLELPKLQRAVSDHGASLIVVHHYNRNTAAHGAARLSGAGWREWSRATLAAETLAKPLKLEDGRWQVDVRISTEGGETPGEEIMFRRHMWKDDPLDLAAPLHYRVEPLTGDALAEVVSMSDSDRTVLRAVEERSGQWLAAKDLTMAAGLALPTVNAALLNLTLKGRVLRAERSGNKFPNLYTKASGDMPELPDMYAVSSGSAGEPF